MKKIALLSCLLLGACSTTIAKVEQAYNDVTSTQVTATQVSLAANAFDILEATGTQYVKLPLCPKAIVCRKTEVVKLIVPLIRSGRVTRSNLETCISQGSGNCGGYDALQATISSLQAIYGQYKIGI